MATTRRTTTAKAAAKKAPAKKAGARTTAKKAKAKDEELVRKPGPGSAAADDVTHPPAKGTPDESENIDKTTGGDTSKEGVKPKDDTGDANNPAPESEPPEVVPAETDDAEPAGIDASGDTQPPPPGTRAAPGSPDTVRNDPKVDELEPTSEFPSGTNPLPDVTADEVPNGQVAPDYENEADPDDVLARRTKAAKKGDTLPTI